MPTDPISDSVLLVDRKILFDCGRDFIAAPGEIEEFGREFFVMARFGQLAKFSRLLTQIGCPLSH